MSWILEMFKVSCPYNSFSLNFSGKTAAKMNYCHFESEQLLQGWKFHLCGYKQRAAVGQVS